MRLLNRGVESLIDAMESFGVLVTELFLLPFLFVRYSVPRFAFLAVHLLPRGHLASFLRAKLSQRLGNASAASQSLITILADLDGQYPAQVSSSQRRMLGRVFRELMVCYLRQGMIEQALGLVLRANKRLGPGGVAGFPKINPQTVQIIKAGLAASQVMEQAASRGMFKEGKPIKVQRKAPQAEASPRGAGPRVIPFPNHPRGL